MLAVFQHETPSGNPGLLRSDAQSLPDVAWDVSRANFCVAEQLLG
jgi:hypothetical protein